jgi:hypothetical protein
MEALISLYPLKEFNAGPAEIMTADVFYRFNPFIIFVVNQNVLPRLIINTYHNQNGLLPRFIRKVEYWAGRFTFVARKSLDLVFIITDKSPVGIENTQAGEMKSN